MPAENIIFNSDIITASDGTQYRVEGSANVYYRGTVNSDGFYTDANYDFKAQIYDLNGKLVGSISETASAGNTDFADGKGNYLLGGKGSSFTVGYSLKPNDTTFTQDPFQVTFTFSGSVEHGTFTGTGPAVSVGQPVCFTTGTLIRTTRGEVAVEALAVGDLAVTASGETRPIVWIGHKVMDCTTRADVWPIRVRAGAFGEDGLLPARDLWLSPGHPVRVGEDDAAHLVPIMCLVNGTTVERVPVDSVTYWHVELDHHDLLLAEGLAAESYLDWGDRPWFANAGEHALMNPDFVVPGLGGRCLPVAIDGPVVEAERRRLDAVFATGLAAHCAWPTAGRLVALDA